MLLLHLSDIHFRKGEVGTAMDPNAHLRRELVRDAADHCERIGAVPDAVLVSGDMAFAGDPDEYDFAVSWLDELCQGCGTKLSTVFVIPGNHDVVRNIASRPLVQSLHRDIKHTSEGGLDGLLRGLLTDQESSRLLYEALGPFNSFAGQFFCDLLPPERTIALSALTSSLEPAFEAVGELWTTRPLEILAIAERAANESSTIADELLHRLSTIVEPQSFLALSGEYPIVREHIIRTDPSLLDSPGIASVPPQELSRLLTLLPDDQELAGRVLNRLLFSDNRDAAELFASRFPELTQDRVFNALVSKLAGSGADVPRAWSITVRDRTPNLASRMLDRCRTTTALAALSGWLDLDVAAGLNASPREWAAVLVRAEDDVSGQPKQRLLVYLLALALAHGSQGSEPLFEKAFESTHADIGAGRLPEDAANALAHVLPKAYWWKEWDKCFRLRLAVVTAYVDNELDPQSFLRLTTNSDLLGSLTDIASDTPRGRDFIMRVFDHDGEVRR